MLHNPIRQVSSGIKGILFASATWAHLAAILSLNSNDRLAIEPSWILSIGSTCPPRDLIMIGSHTVPFKYPIVLAGVDKCRETACILLVKEL